MATNLGRFISRQFSTARALQSIPTQSATAGEHGDYKLWKRLFFVVFAPAIGLAMLNIYLEEKNNPPQRPEFKKYDYLRVRNKPFPWGDGNHSLFHNPHTNALPDGYEDDHH